MLGTTPLCQGTKNRAFIDVNADRFKIAAAVKICSQCPMIQECARAALTAGGLQDGTQAVANGVIQAGVVCQGDHATVDALNAVANAPEATHSPHAREVQPRALITPGQPCKECSRPLWKFTRDRSEIPEGYVIHHARGWCKHCRGAYNAFMAHTPKRQTRERQRRPRHCIQCQHPMVPMSHDLPTDNHVRHMSRGRCMKCSRLEQPPRCLGCQKRLIGYGETPSSDDEAPVHGHGRCGPCYHRHRHGYSKRRELPTLCQGGCGLRLTTIRENLPQGYVTHHSRGWCDACRNRQRRRMKRDRLTATQLPA